MLAKSAFKQWQKDPNAEIFLKRDGLHFRYILDYMRDYKVVLPVTKSREIIVADLEYYGVEVVEDSIDNTALNKLKCFKSIEEVMDTLEGVMSASGEEYFVACIAKHCIKLWCKDNTLGLAKNRPREVTYGSCGDPITDDDRNMKKNSKKST